MDHKGQKQLQIEDYIEIILRRKWFIIIPFVLSVIGTIVALKTIPPMYKSTTLILVEPQKVPESYVRSTVTVDIRDRLNTITQQVMSRTRLESILNELDLYRDKRDVSISEEVVGLMRRNIEVAVKGRNSASFTISYIGEDPETVMHVTTRLASLFMEENLKVREQQAEGTTEFLDTQLLSLKASLEAQEEEIKLFKEKFMGELPSQLNTNLRTLDRIQLDLQATNDALRVSEDRKIVLEKQLTELKQNRAGEAVSVDQMPRQSSRLNQLKAELSQLSNIYTDKYPDVIRIKKQIAEIEKQLIKEISLERKSEIQGSPAEITDNPLHITIANQLKDVNANIKNLKEKQMRTVNHIAVLQGRVERIPQREQQMSALLRDYENTRGNYQNLLNKKLDAQLSENLEKRQKGEQFRIIDPANLPESPFKPDPKKIIMVGLALGLGIGGGLAFLLEYIDASFRKADDVYAAVGIPVLASIPRMRTGK